MAFLPSAHTNNITIPKGRVFLKAEDEINYRYLGSNQTATLTRDVEGIDLRSAEDGIGKRLEHHTINIDYTLTLNISDISELNLALFVNGTPYIVTQTSGSGSEDITAGLAGLYRLGVSTLKPSGDRSISGVTIENKAGAAATAWQATTLYSIDDLSVPSVANGYFFIVTTAGTSAASEPTWPTTVGATVTDGTVVWTNAGSIALTADVDYELDTTLGQVFIKSDAPNVIAGDVYTVDYTMAGVTWTEVKDSPTQKYYDIIINSTNPVGKPIDYNFPRCTLEASGDLILKSDETAYQLFEVAVHILEPDDGRSAVYIDGRPIA